MTGKLLGGWGSSEAGLPARWAVFLAPGKGLPVKKVRPLPALDAQDEGLPVLKGRLKERLQKEGVPVEMKEALTSQKTIQSFPFYGPNPVADPFTNLSLWPLPLSRYLNVSRETSSQFPPTC